ncbi:hypothetical protein [Niallia endozanthoxylica]|uniref:Uncharacterized protein n=1 Tax=Niallia endozanthoxylica TaxID=2036016 RepID=A0A5J5HPE6_9BACI|nr:hypothetical protein [Niallia endozanthoxylica]KAA9023550.1 hypothetical protein F4V44_12850 [Niallia endozanthoxylica]
MPKTHDIAVTLDNEWLNEFQLENVVRNPEINFGLLIASRECLNECQVNLFLLQFDEDDENYFILNEITTFSFQSESHQRDFIRAIPNMSAIDLMMFISTNELDPVTANN